MHSPANFRNFRKRYANQHRAVHPAVNAQIAVQSGKFPQFPQALRQSVPVLHAAQETANPRLFLARRAWIAASKRPPACRSLGQIVPLVGVTSRPCSSISESLIEEHKVSDTNLKVQYHLEGNRSANAPWALFFAASVGDLSFGVFAHHPTQKLTGAGARRQSISGGPGH
jgi:hypothetical protein